MTANAMPQDILQAVRAQADFHHQYFLGLQLMVASQEGPQVVGDWMFRLFRRQHEEKFLSSFAKLGLSQEPDAVACAKYHVLSNGVGGVAVEYMEESARKAWVRFRYPRWMYDGPVICGIPVEASRGFLRGWYAQNGVSLSNPRLGFVCVSEDMTGQFGLCGYFYEYDEELAEDQRLRFAPEERPPAFNPAMQPEPPAAEWNAERLAKANRNYALEYIRNGLAALTSVLGEQRAVELGRRAARLIGLQCYPRLAAMLEVQDGDLAEAARFLARALSGMGDDCTVEQLGADAFALRQSGFRAARGLTGDEREVLLLCWTELYRGAIASHRLPMQLDVEWAADGLLWQLKSA